MSLDDNSCEWLVWEAEYQSAIESNGNFICLCVYLLCKGLSILNCLWGQTLEKIRANADPTTLIMINNSFTHIKIPLIHRILIVKWILIPKIYAKLRIDLIPSLHSCFYFSIHSCSQVYWKIIPFPKYLLDPVNTSGKCLGNQNSVADHKCCLFNVFNLPLAITAVPLSLTIQITESYKCLGQEVSRVIEI